MGALGHGREVTPLCVLQTALPLWVAWMLLALWRDPYEGPLANLFLVWMLALPLGAVARGVLLGRGFSPEQLPFLGIAMAFTLPFMLLARKLV